MRRLRVLLFGLVATLAVGVGSSALAQYPIAGVDDCAEAFDDDGTETTVFAPGDEIQVQGREGCAQPDEQDIEALLFSDPVVLDVFDANADGSYVSAVVRIPTDTEPGDHDVVVRTANAEYVQPISVTDGAVPSGLPETGRNVAILALWGTLTLVLGSTLIGLTWRRWREARVGAELDRSLAGRSFSVGTLTEREASPYRPRATEWVDPPETDDPEGTAELPAHELEGAEAEPERPRVRAASNGGRRAGEEAREIATRASSRTTEIVGRLQGELAAWRE